MICITWHHKTFLLQLHWHLVITLYCMWRSVCPDHRIEVTEALIIWSIRRRCAAVIDVCGDHPQYWLWSFSKWPHTENSGRGNHPKQWCDFKICFSIRTVEWHFLSSNFVTYGEKKFYLVSYFCMCWVYYITLRSLLYTNTITPQKSRPVARVCTL